MAIDILKLKPNVISRDLRGKYILLAGAPKIGKTEFCCQSEKALICAFEIGTNAQPNAIVQPITTWSDFKLVLRQLDTPEAKETFSTVCIDTIGIAYDVCEQFICSQNSVSKIGDIAYGAGYAALSKEFESSLRKITMMGYGLIMTSHLKEIYDEEGKLISAKPDLNNRCLKIVNAIVDIIGVITQTWNEKGESERWVQTRSTPYITAGTRFKFLAPKIPFGFENFENALAKAIEEEGKNGATIVDKATIITEEKLDFKALLNEAKDIWETLVNYFDTNEEKLSIVREMSKKIELIFGQKIKLSEVTEDQAQLLNLVLIDLRDLKKEKINK